MEFVIALGANLGEPERSFQRALFEIERWIGPVVARSQWHRTAPLLHPSNPAPQPDYLNGVVLVSSSLSCEGVFLHLQAIEERLGRVKEVGEKWSARLIDLDLIAAESTVLSTPHLTIPHPEMQRREFVLGPMAEVVPQWRHPLLGKTVQELRSAL